MTATGQECRETLLIYRGPDRTPWWNEIYLAPVTDEHGTVVQYIDLRMYAGKHPHRTEQAAQTQR